MRRDLLGAARLLLTPTLAVAIVLAFLPGRAGIAVRIYALVLCAVALWVALAALRRAYPAASPLRPAGTSADRRPRPPSSLARLEHETAIGVAGAFDLHRRLVPRLRSLAAGLLATRRRVSLDGDPGTARAALGDETWALVRRDRRPPEDRLSRGVSPDALGRVVDSLERL